MAKSLGNFIFIKGFLKENSARLLRLLIIKNHYRSPFNYNEKLLSQTKKELGRIEEFIDKLEKSDFSNINIRNSDFKILKFQKTFDKAMEDDFNTPKAVAVIFELTNKGNSLIDKSKLTKKDAKGILEFLKKVDRVFNFIYWQKPKEKTPKEIFKLSKEREECRKEGNWQKADKIRKEIEKKGYKIEDTKKGPKIKKISNF